MHFGLGALFYLGYYLIFLALDWSGWLLGAALGLAHGLFSATALANILLPAVHPRMGKPWTDASRSPFIEAPAFLMRNYGPATPLVTTNSRTSSTARNDAAGSPPGVGKIAAASPAPRASDRAQTRTRTGRRSPTPTIDRSSCEIVVEDLEDVRVRAGHGDPHLGLGRR